MQSIETWIPSLFRVEQEDENGVVLITCDSNIRVRYQKGDYRITESGVIELRLGCRAEWFDPPLSCQIKK